MLEYRGVIMAENPPTHAHKSTLEDDFDCPSLVRVLRWLTNLFLAGSLLTIVAQAQVKLVKTPWVTMIWPRWAALVWVIAALVLAVQYWIQIWRNAEMLVPLHPDIAFKLKSLFWSRLTWIPFTVVLAGALIGWMDLMTIFTLLVLLVALWICLPVLRDHAFGLTRRSNVLTASWIAQGAAAVMILCILVVSIWEFVVAFERVTSQHVGRVLRIVVIAS